MCAKIILLSVALLTWCSASLGFKVESRKSNIICYYGTWATYRPSNGKFDVENIDPFLCTHIIYSFAGINDQGVFRSLDTELDIEKDNYRKLTGLKQKNPNLKTILAVGGWNEGSANYSLTVGDPELRKNFINTSLQFITTYGFDGLDLDWEYPNQRDTVNGKADVDNFTQLLKELKEEFQKHGYLLSAAVASVKASASLSYDIAAISQYLDTIHVMTYDLYGSWDGATGYNAPLHKGEGYDNVADADYNSVENAIDYWLGEGAPTEKVALAIPFYGRTFNLTDVNVNGTNSPATGAGTPGPYTREAGTIGYNELCEQLQLQPWDVRYDSAAKVPYAVQVQGRDWISFDNSDSIAEKVKWGIQKKITNFFVWSIETDDFHGLCGEPFPLLKAINKALGRNVGGN